MLPLTLLSGIYGMNVALPLDENSPVTFVIILFLMVLMAGGMIFYFKRRRWI
jgi:magnesium transporter